jgi:signal transduction histidine kinase/HAMP domain-containing protein
MRTKITLTIFFIILLFSLGVGFAIKDVVLRKTNYIIENSVKNLVKVNEGVVLQDLLEENYWNIFKIMHSLKKVDLIKNATFVNKNNIVIASSEPKSYPIGSSMKVSKFNKDFLTIPLRSDNLVFGYFIIQKEFGFLDSLIKDIKYHLLLSIIVAALISILIGYLISVRIIGRLELLSRNAKMIEKGKWDKIIKRKSFEKDEITELSTVIDNMIKKIKEMILVEQNMKIFYHNILENLDELVIICDREFKIIYHNSNKLKNLIIESKKINEEVLNTIKNKILWQEENFVIEIPNESGKTLHIHINLKNISNDMVLSFSNITFLKKLEEQVLFKNSFEIVGEISSEVVHEVKNYLQPIRILLEQDRIDSEDKQRILNIILKINNLVQNFLKSGRPIDKKLLVKININKKIGNILFVFSQKLTEKNIKLLKSIDNFIYLYMAEFDFSSILTNLLSNAIDACEIGGQIQIECEQKDKNIILKISNTGNEIDKEIIKKIHKPFFTTKKDGSGIGLYTVYKTVYLYGGFINVNSNPERTIFSINLPKGDKNEYSHH